jgi:iron complex outermembrane receptor protein
VLKTALLCGGSALAVVVSLSASPAAAADPTSADNSSGAAAVGEITVVAQKREEKIETVPVAVTAFSAKQRSLIGIQTVQDLTDYTPGLSFTSVSDRPYIRGVGRNTDNLSTASAVASYYNGIYYGANASILLQKDDLFVGNVEVDRGPQNSLHGSNADGGTILFTSQRPTSTFYAEGRAGVANFGEEFGEAVVSGPITDNVKFRLGGNYTNMSGGYFKNLEGLDSQGGNLPNGSSGRTYYAEGQIQANFDKLDIWAMASTGDFDTNFHTSTTVGNIPTNLFSLALAGEPSDFYGLCGLPGVATSAADAAGCATGPGVVPGSVKTGPVTANLFPGNNPGNLNQRSFLQLFTSTNTDHGDVALATNITYHFPSVDVTYLGGYQSFDYELNYTTATGAGVSQYQLNGPSSAAAAGLCAFVSGANAAGCLQPLTINPSPNLTYFAEKDAYFSNEVDFTSTWDSPFQYVAGLYWYHEHYDQPVDAGVEPNQAQMGAPTSLATLGPAAPNPSRAFSTSDTTLTYDSYAGFLSGSYKFNDQFKFAGAVRYTSDHKEGVQQWRVVEFDQNLGPGLNFSSTGWGANTPALDFTPLAVATELAKAYPGAGKAFLNAATGNAERDLNATWSAVTGEATLDWTPNPSTLAYFKYARGYKSGGFSTYTIGPDPETTPEYVDSFEVGAKKTFGSRITLNGAAFYYNYYNDQVPLTIIQSTGAGGGTTLVPVLFNVPLVHSYGVELEGVWRPIDPLTLSLNYSYLNATIADAGGCILDSVDPQAIQAGANTQGCTVAGTQNIKGQQLPESPPNKISFNALYTFKFDPGDLTLSGSVIWKDVTYDAVFNRPYDKQSPYSLVNLRATWASANGRYNVIAFIDNVFDTTGFDGALGTLLAQSAGAEDIISGYSLTAPRTFGIQFQYRFK